MRNIKMVVAYDGSNYHGFQAQNRTALKTVQGELETALETLTGEKTSVIGSGRTDAGVHAWGQAVNFRSDTRIPEAKIPFALNSVLPRDIVVREAQDVPEDFHARFSAKKKTYCYTIYNDRHMSPFWRQYAWHVPVQLDTEKIAVGAEKFIGEHDFTAFCANNTEDGNHIRRIYDFTLATEGPLVRFTVTGSGFLWNMVRIMTGTLLEVGAGKRAPEDITALLLVKERKSTGMTLPPQGLCLMSVEY